MPVWGIFSVLGGYLLGFQNFGLGGIFSVSFVKIPGWANGPLKQVGAFLTMDRGPHGVLCT